MSWRHGTQYGYRRRGCRCDECRGWAARHAWRCRHPTGRPWPGDQVPAGSAWDETDLDAYWGLDGRLK